MPREAARGRHENAHEAPVRMDPAANAKALVTPSGLFCGKSRLSRREQIDPCTYATWLSATAPSSSHELDRPLTRCRHLGAGRHVAPVFTMKITQQRVAMLQRASAGAAQPLGNVLACVP